MKQEMNPVTKKKTEHELQDEEIIERYPSTRDSLIPLLQDIQEKNGFLSKENIYSIADHLDLPESKIFGVATFYNQFKLNPPGKYQIQVCRGTACHVKGSLNLLEFLKQELGIVPGETTVDGFFSLEVVACLGACSIAPVMTINHRFYGRLDKKKVEDVMKTLRTEGEK